MAIDRIPTDMIVDRTSGEKLSTSLAEIAYNPINFGCKFDGITDDSADLQAFFDLPDVKGRVKFPNSGVLYLTHPVYINKDNIEIDFNNCQIKWAGDTDLGTDALNRQVGAINIKGTDSSVGDITNFIPRVISDTHSGRYYSVVTIPSASSLAVGDYVKVVVQKSSTQDANSLNTYVDVLCKVVDIVGNDVYVDYSSPFDFPTPYYFARMYKVTPRKNVLIKNYRFTDTMPWTNISIDDSLTPNPGKLVCGLYFSLCVNCYVDKIYGEFTKNPLIFVNESKSVHIQDLEVYRPNITSPGRGYGVQFVSSTECSLNRGYGYYARHVVDFTASTYCKASNINGRYMFAISFMTHGKYEHDIEFERCYGATALGATLDFGYASYNVTYRGCKINRMSMAYAKGLKFYDSTVYYTSPDSLADSSYVNGLNAVTEMTFKNCNVYFYKGHYKKKTRENNVFTFLEVIDSKVEFLNTGTGLATTQYFEDIDLVKFTNCKINIEDNKTNTASRYVTLNGCGRLVVNGKSVLTNTNFYITSSVVGDFDCDDVILRYSSGATGTESFISTDYGTIKRTIRLSKIKIDYNASTTLRLIRVGGTPTATVYIRTIITENDINALGTGKVSLFLPQSSSQAKNNSIVVNNILLNTQQEGFVTTDFPNNLWA